MRSLQLARHCVAILASLLASGGTALADDPAPPAPYSLPWSLRPAAVADVIRWDTVLADFEDASGTGGDTVVSGLIWGAKVNDRVGTLVRAALVRNDPPSGDSAAAFANPVVGGSYLMKPAQDVRVLLFLGLAIPAGQGAGNDPPAAKSAAVRSGVLARSAMDNAMYAVNDVVLFPGVDVAWVKGGFTLQYEATLLQLKRVRGEKAQPDEDKTNFTTGLHFGYFVGKRVSLGADLRYQRWLSTPAAVEANGSLRDNLSICAGPRFHVELRQKRWLRPGISYAVGLDGAIEDLDYRIVQVDLPLYF